MPRFVFLICSERSGATLVERVLSNHSSLCAPYPTGLFRMLGTERGRHGDLSTDERWDALISDVLNVFHRRAVGWNTSPTPGALRKQVRRRTGGELLRVIYDGEADEEGATHVLVREHQVCRFAPFLLGHFPDCQFVYLVRDPRDVTAAWAGNPAAQRGIDTVVDAWVNDQLESLDLYHQLNGTGRMHLIRFEDLLREPGGVLLELTAFMGLIMEETMLQVDQAPRTERNGDRIHARVDISRTVIRGKTGLYRETLTEDAVRYVELRSFEIMRQLGYEAEFVGRLPGHEERERETAELWSFLAENGLLRVARKNNPKGV